MKRDLHPFDHQGKRPDQVEYSLNAAGTLFALLVIFVLIVLISRYGN